MSTLNCQLVFVLSFVGAWLGVWGLSPATINNTTLATRQFYAGGWLSKRSPPLPSALGHGTSDNPADKPQGLQESAASVFIGSPSLCTGCKKVSWPSPWSAGLWAWVKLHEICSNLHENGRRRISNAESAVSVLLTKWCVSKKPYSLLTSWQPCPHQSQTMAELYPHIRNSFTCQYVTFWQ